MTMVKSISKGDKFVFAHTELKEPLLGTVIALTDAPGKKIGLEFEVNVSGHSCDGRGKHGHCLWAAPAHVYTPEEYEQILKTKNEVKRVVTYNEFDKISL